MNTISVMTFNIHSAIGRDETVNVDRIVDVIRDVDIVALQEVDNYWERSGNVSQVDLITDALPDHFHAWHPVIDLWKSPQTRRQYGNLLLSRFPIKSIKRHALPKSAHDGRLALQCGVLEAIVAVPFADIRVYATHAISSDSAMQIERLLDIYRTSRTEGAPISGSHDDKTWFEEEQPTQIPTSAVLLGDLNIRPGSEDYHCLTRAAVSPECQPLVDAWSRGNPSSSPNGFDGESDQGATYYVDFDKKSGERLDYCFVSADIADRIQSAQVLSELDASDHQPLKVTINSQPPFEGGQ
ncbi:endonuclease/exonuclease/phosphatase family protein [Microvirga sp. VF16]|uniref:endonuclease/exonuclease/phosphatase family protein n=1 Tax=Microvirga sp. VF16 TaxID=2807101 RepID=UPI00193E10D6|nr:endonuclease/exonuclease/phosphatase family protein [Microvirga sp. VF16]QRM32586.1 endonuclease/exonuclease/phosphatase family protein [Microvirga sp. VF16]